MHLRLYVAPNSEASLQAHQHLEAAVGDFEEHPVELEILDVTEEPDKAARDHALVTPMLVRLQPEPIRRVGGTLENRANLLAVLRGH